MRPRIDYTNKDYESLREALLELARERLPEWSDHSPNDLGVMMVEAFSYLGDVLLYYQDRIANESYLETAVERRSVMHLLRLIGYELHPALPSSADLTLLFKDDVLDLVTINTGAIFETTAKVTGKPVSFQYLGAPLVIDLSRISITVRYQDNKLYKPYDTLPVTQVDNRVANENLGSSDGSANQRYTLLQQPLITETLEVMVDEGGGAKAWTRQETLLYSQSTDEHYMIQRDADDRAVVIFGDGRYGKIPRRGRSNITASYRIGGGIKGNVPANSITKVVTSVTHLEKVYNKFAASGGLDHEDVNDAAQRAPRLFRSHNRAVTAQDYESHARAFGVGKARARAGSWNRIELFVAPAGGGQPTDTLKDDLRAYFESRRIMTAILDIRDPMYVAVTIEADLEVEAYYFTDQVAQLARDAVRNLLRFEKVNFEDVLYISKFYEVIEAIEGVRGVNITRFSRPDSLEELPKKGLLKFEWNEIPIAKHIEGVLLNSVRGGRSGS